MRLSAPIFKLKREAKLLARDRNIPLHRALDSVAMANGFQSWSHLASAPSRPRPAQRILAGLQPGDMLLVAARPGHGKTLLGLDLAILASEIGRSGVFFTLEYTESDVAECCTTLGFNRSGVTQPVRVDTSDRICAGYIIETLGAMPESTLAVVDYLQLLDQRRTNPPLDRQISDLKAYAKRHGTIFVLISQVDRSFETTRKPMPDVSDIRLPNPIDLTAFDKTCFLNDGDILVAAAA